MVVYENDDQTVWKCVLKQNSLTLENFVVKNKHQLECDCKCVLLKGYPCVHILYVAKITQTEINQSYFNKRFLSVEDIMLEPMSEGDEGDVELNEEDYEENGFVPEVWNPPPIKYKELKHGGVNLQIRPQASHVKMKIVKEVDVNELSGNELISAVHGKLIEMQTDIQRYDDQSLRELFVTVVSIQQQFAQSNISDGDGRMQMEPVKRPMYGGSHSQLVKRANKGF